MPTGGCLPSAVEWRMSINHHTFVSLGRPCLQGTFLLCVPPQALHSPGPRLHAEPQK